MKKKPKSPRIEIGTSFSAMVNELLKETNKENRDNPWNPTDLTRFAIAELWERYTKKPLPREAEKLLR
jgi:hypothetical protein